MANVKTTTSRLKLAATSNMSPKKACVLQQKAGCRSMATIVPPVTQDSTSSMGPTAMVFMNMGGPSTTDAVGDFLSRLFVKPP